MDKQRSSSSSTRTTPLNRPTRVKVSNLEIGHSIWVAKGYRKITKIDGTLVRVESIPWPLKMKAGDEVWAVDEDKVPPATTAIPDWDELLANLSEAIGNMERKAAEEASDGQ